MSETIAKLKKQIHTNVYAIVEIDKWKEKYYYNIAIERNGDIMIANDGEVISKEEAMELIKRFNENNTKN